MKIIDINTGEVIEVWEDIPGGPYWTIKEYWFKYKAECRKWEDDYAGKGMWTQMEFENIHPLVD